MTNTLGDYQAHRIRSGSRLAAIEVDTSLPVVEVSGAKIETPLAAHGARLGAQLAARTLALERTPEVSAMLCKDLMKAEVECVEPDDLVGVAARKMRDDCVGFLPVCESDGQIVGTLTDRDITIRLVAEDLPLDIPVRDIMTAEVVACDPDDSLEEAQLLMGRARVSRILCVDGNSGRLAGVISLSDIAQLEEGARAARTLREVTSRETRVSIA
jgi:CBS domain-containing protein